MTQLSINEKKDIILKNFQLDDVPEVPFLVEFGPLHLATDDYFYNFWSELKWNEEFHKKREGIYDYGMPNIKPNLGIGIIAAAFGCEQIVNGAADPWIKPLIFKDNINNVYELKIPDSDTSPVLKNARERINFFQNNSSLPLRMVNVPSPLVTASLICDYTFFFEALILHSKEMHMLMQKITELTIVYIKEQFRLIKNLYSVGHEMWHIPRSGGVRISDDTAALLSPKLYREFGVKYNSVIAEAFGGIIIHSCGDVQNVVSPMMEIKNLRGLDFTIPQNPNWEIIREAAGGKTALYLRYYYFDYENNGGKDPVAYSKKIVDFFGRKGLFIQTSTRSLEEAVHVGAELHRILSG